MPDSNDPITAYPDVKPAPQDQTPGTGLDKKLDPPANFAELEFWTPDGKPYLQDYVGRDLLKDKKALITGGDSGIGRSVAILFAREGADVTINYLSPEETDAQDTKRMVEKAGRKCVLGPADLREEANCRDLVKKHIDAFGRLDVLVNNSAMQEIQPNHEDIDLSSVESTFRTNILAQFALIKFALPHMARGTAIVNSTSVAAYTGNPELVDYSATKGAIVAMTRSLAQQLAPRGIRVNAVAPGIIWTPLQPATKGNKAEDVEDLGTRGEVPLGRPGMPVEMATAYVFLASPLASYCTGETMHGNGGMAVQG